MIVGGGGVFDVSPSAELEHAHSLKQIHKPPSRQGAVYEQMPVPQQTVLNTF